jgi:hypothetical protein
LTYPSTIRVSGFKQGRIQKVRVGLLGLSHTNVNDLDIMLVAPGNTGIMLMSDAGSSVPVTNLTLILDQDAPGPLPDPLTSGVFQPANYQIAFDPMPGPAPAGVSGHSLTRLTNRDPNGLWQLFVADDLSFDGGTLAGWSLTIQARVQVPHRHRRRRRR